MDAPERKPMPPLPDVAYLYYTWMPHEWRLQAQDYFSHWNPKPYVPKTALDAAAARAEAAEAALAEIAAAVGCIEGEDSLDRELIRNIKARLALLDKEPK